MNFDEYQKFTGTIATYTNKTSIEPLYYVALALGGEVGEIQNKVKKIIRDHDGIMDENSRMKLIYELGDLLWYISEMATVLDVDLGLVADLNQAKLQGRQKRGTIHGSGDNR